MALNIITQVLAPTLSMALTSGPTTPEVSSFEPVDTTDMVDLATGDFNYNIPLMDIPGPEGGYPLALSYHAGMMPGQDASWVGLGWNLNPGAINRTVNNFADDYNNATYSIYDEWNGGESLEYNFGVGVTFANLVSVGVDVGVKQDTYKGNSGSFGLTAGIGVQMNSGLKASYNLTTGYDTRDGNFSSVSLGLSAGAVGIGMTSGNYGGESYTYIGITESLSQSSMGITMSSSGLKNSAVIAGGVRAHNSNGNLKTSSGSFSMQLPIGYFYVSIGYKYLRYWIRGGENTALLGVLNSTTANNAVYNGYPLTAYAYGSFDCNVLYDPEKNVGTQANLDWTTNPVVATYDNYMVTGQGISGSIEPILLDNGSFFRKMYNDPTNNRPEMKTDIYRPFSIQKHMFRFRNDFSNSHKVKASDFNISGSNLTYPLTGMSYATDQIDPRGYKKTVDGYNRPTSVRIAGSKHIEYYTNEEIANNTAKSKGFINTPTIPIEERSTRSFTSGVGKRLAGYKSAAYPVVDYDVKKNIGGYSITNEAGVTYHYALPAYTNDYTQYSTAPFSLPGSIIKRTVANRNPYAYTWLLTAVTGPDYVDVNKDGLVDKSDWGYWVNFEYGRWTDRYGYRTPDSGKNVDVDGSTVYSKGAKEIYYLNKINTRTHTALFVKEERVDVVGTNSFDYETYNKSVSLNSSNNTTYGTYEADVNAYNPVKSLKLSEIILLENNLFDRGTVNYVNDCHETVSNDASYIEKDCNYLYHTSATGFVTNYQPIVNWGNVLDKADLDAVCNATSRTNQPPQFFGEAIRNSAIKRIVFGHDYSLCKKTPNSINEVDFGYQAPIPDGGKLTLNNIRVYGRNQVQLMPSTNFNYELDNPVSESMQIGFSAGDVGFSGRMGRIDCSGPNDFNVGDIIKCEVNSKTFYMTLTKAIPYYGAPNSLYDVLFLGPNIPAAADKWKYTTATQTKNPPYTADFYDIWGMFKSDYNPGPNVKRNKARAVTEASSKGVDCWSLRSIEMPTGAKITIEHESDDYKNVVLKNLQIYNAKPNIRKKSGTNTSFTGYQREFSKNGLEYGVADIIFEIYEGDLQVPLTEIFTVGDNIQMVTACQYMVNTSIQGFPATYKQNVLSSMFTVPIIGVTANTITIKDKNSTVLNSSYAHLGANEYLYSTVTHLGSYIFSPKKLVNYGGGLRTKSIQLTDGLVASKTTYEYKSNAKGSSGSTSFDPLSFNELERIIDIFPIAPTNSIPSSFQNDYSQGYFGSFAKIMAIAKDMIAPGIFYEYIKVKNDVTKNGVTTEAPTYQVFQFQPFEENMLQFYDLSAPPASAGAQVRTSKINDFTNLIGNFLSVKSYDKNNRLLSEIFNDYTINPENGQGVVEQVFHEQRRVNPDEGPDWERRFGVVTVKSEYTSKLVATTKRDYVKGIYEATENTAFDFYSGAVTETLTQDSYGNAIVSTIEPAYNYYPGMGLKTIDPLNSNMLVQSAGANTFKRSWTTTSLGCNVTSTSNPIAPNEVLVTLTGNNVLPQHYHIGSKVVGLSLPVFITYIAQDRKSFKTISRQTSAGIDIGAKTLTVNTSSAISASVNTWNDQWDYRKYSGTYTTVPQDEISGTLQKEKVWRMKSTYSWNSVYTNADGTYPNSGLGVYVPFDYLLDYQTNSTGIQPGKFWANVNTNTLFSSNSKPLEQRNVNGKYSSMKFANNETYPLATAMNARYTEFTHSGAEFYDYTNSYSEGEVSGGASEGNSHTGKYHFDISSGKTIKYTTVYSNAPNIFYENNKAYRIAVWVNKSSVVNAQLYYTSTVGTTPTTIFQAYDPSKHVTCGNWVLMTMDITTPPSSTKLEVGVKHVGTTGYISVDDFRFQPSVSSVQSFVYDTDTGLLTHVLGEDNRYTRYEYDSSYRLKATYKETTNGEVKVNEYNYNFARPIGY